MLNSGVLLLNKRDVFEEKIQKTDLNVCFSDYTGGKNYEASTEFIKNQFISQVASTQKQINSYVTTATETGHVREVFTQIKDLLVKKKNEANAG